MQMCPTGERMNGVKAEELTEARSNAATSGSPTLVESGRVDFLESCSDCGDGNG
jgi:hypothetical protein